MDYQEEWVQEILEDMFLERKCDCSCHTIGGAIHCVPCCDYDE